jgi:hypothetical protein
MHALNPAIPLPQAEQVSKVLADFTRWLRGYGETSWDHQSFFAGPVGRRAKALYYRNRLLGTAAVAPMIFFEAFVPSARRLFHRRTRFPIADAHYAMGFASLFQATSDAAQLQRAIHFLEELKKSRLCRVLLGLPLRLGDAQRHEQGPHAIHHQHPVCLRGIPAGS